MFLGMIGLMILAGVLQMLLVAVIMTALSALFSSVTAVYLFPLSGNAIVRCCQRVWNAIPRFAGGLGQFYLR